MAQKLSVREFFQRFPSDDACLEHVMQIRYGLRHICGACGVDATFHRIAGRRGYACAHCGGHVYPCAGTVLEDSRTALQLWFYAIYLFVTTRHGVSGKELQRQLGVTYKTAWRMGHQIRLLTDRADLKGLLDGHVEIDEAYVGGRRKGKPGRGAAGKTIVMGLQKRDGRLHTEIIPNVRTKTLREVVNRTVAPFAKVSTDELNAYGLLIADTYRHGVVKHSTREYVRGEHHTNTVESFWRLFKYSIRSTHIHVSQKHMDKYLREFTFRSNHRQMENAMFDVLIGAL